MYNQAQDKKCVILFIEMKNKLEGFEEEESEK